MTNEAKDRTSFDLRNPFIHGSPNNLKYKTIKSPGKESQEKGKSD